MKTSGFNQDGAVVISFKRTIMVYKRGHAPKLQRPEHRQAASGEELLHNGSGVELGNGRMI